ncbi:DNA repair protein RAD50.L isoform X2 [Halyomorpha halys]|uniref:DNA repair protein RAD50.L isoform X2 n=1 Tax=Halyomorpha halys TaxID=286706 RepID=UPI0006D52681|nr:DNA repair protein RAD50 isoform X2 [Halyomorpha halys]XP_014291154.1 DNA repair protein RAD50 isoform X2 [Halyomorpha halys]
MNVLGRIHLPKTKAQINLKLRDVKGEVMSVLRLMTATQKQKKSEFKTLDQTINRLDRNGQWVSISHKCADVDSEMSIALGVSKAILSNVLLCHQEESNWPLDKDNEVKKRFDAIFGAEHYNKCLSHIRDLRKSLLEDMKTMKIDLHYLKEYKKEAGEKRAKMTDVELKISKHNDDIACIKVKLLPVQNRLKELAELEDKISSLHIECEKEKARLGAVKNSISEYRKNITIEFKGTTDELKDTIRNFSHELKKKESKLETLEKEGEDVAKEIERNQQLIGTEKMKIGQLMRDFENHKELIDRRNASLLKLSNELCINTSFSELTQGREADRIMVLVDEEISKKKDSIKELEKEQRTAISKLQSEIDNTRESRSKLEQSIENKRSTIRQTRTDLQKIKSDISDVDQSTQLLSQLETKIDRVKNELDIVLKNTNVEKLEDDIKSAEAERNRYEEELCILEKDIQVLQLQSKEQAKLDVQRKARSASEVEIIKLKNKHSSTLKHLLGEVPEMGIKMQLEAYLVKLGDLIKTKNEEIKVKENEIIGYEAEKRHLSAKLKTLKETFEADEFSINKVCEGKDLDQYLAEITSKLEELQDQKGTLSASQFMSRRYIQSLQQKEPSCPLCHRGFTKEDEVTELIKELTLKVKEVPSKLRANRDNLESMQEKHKNLLQLKPKFDKLSAMKFTEIPNLESDLKKLEKKLGSAREALEILQNDLQQPETDVSLGKGILSDIVLLEQHLADLRRIDREIAKLEANMPPGSTRTLEESLQDQKELREKVLIARRDLEEKQSTKNRFIDKRNKLQEEKNAIQNQQFKISGNAQMRAQLIERRDELESLEVMLQMEVDKGSEDLEALSRQLESLLRQKKSLESSQTVALEEVRQKVRKLEGQYGEVNTQQIRISEYEHSGGSKKLEQAQQNLVNLENKGDSLQMKRMAISDERDSLKNYLTSQNARQRELNDNLKLRETLIEEKELAQKISILINKIGNLDCTKLNQERISLKKDEDRFHYEMSSTEGALRELKNTLKSIEDELNRDQYKNADKNYRDKLIDLEVTDAAAEDLNKYYVAFDNALITFHNERMQQINKVIHELWRRIYSGNDIDSIQIHTEQEGSTSADKKKVYNYRVVQMKDGKELDMRGRCSAGQKVLASLIIRIALAETFGSKCGVLALDEPTTNLDHQNIQKLSIALKELVETHAIRKNFQLIVITHDLAFLRILTETEKIDHYFELSRNMEGKSVVSKIVLH